MYQLVGLNDGTFLATTQAAHYINTSYMRSVLHLDASGDIIAVKNHNGFAMLDMTELTDGDIAFTAKSDGTGQLDQYYIGVMKPNLDFKWVKKVRSVPGHQILGMERVDNAGFIVCLQNPGDDCLGESVVFRSDNLGNIQWSKALKDGAFFSIQHLAMPDNGLAWVSYNPVIDTAVIINRVNTNGLIGACPTTDSQPFTLVDTTIAAVSANWEVSPGEPWVSTQPLTFVPINAAIEDYCPNLALDASFVLSEDTVCQQTIIQAVPDNILGNSNWFFGVNGVLGTRVTPGSVRAVMSQPGLIPITHVRSLGLCSDTLVQQVWVKPGPLANLGPDQSICPGDSTTIAPPAASNVSIEWSTGATDSELLVTVPGTYAITVEGPECSSVDTIKISQAPVPVVDLGADQVFCLDETFTITPTVTPQGGSFLWSDGSTGATLEVRDSNQYKLTVQIGECTATDSVVIGFQWCPGVFLYVPNVFAPDGTAENNTFKTSSFSVEIKKMAVYDRWGSLVFQAAGAPFEWDGQVKGETAAPGVYAYWIEYLDTLSGDLFTKTGSVTVIR
jgi:gliding motility-associated-like protein